MGGDSQLHGLARQTRGVFIAAEGDRNVRVDTKTASQIGMVAGLAVFLLGFLEEFAGFGELALMLEFSGFLKVSRAEKSARHDEGNGNRRQPGHIRKLTPGSLSRAPHHENSHS